MQKIKNRDMFQITHRDVLENNRDPSYQGRSFERSRDIYQSGGLPPGPVLYMSQPQQGVYHPLQQIQPQPQKQQQQQQQQQQQRPHTAQSRMSPARTTAPSPSRQPTSLLARSTSAKEIRPISPIYRLEDVSIGLQAKLTKICSSKVNQIVDSFSFSSYDHLSHSHLSRPLFRLSILCLYFLLLILSSRSTVSPPAFVSFGRWRKINVRFNSKRYLRITWVTPTVYGR